MTSKRSRLARLALRLPSRPRRPPLQRPRRPVAPAPTPVIRTVAYHSIKGPSLVWNKQTCRYAVAKSHPKTYATAGCGSSRLR